MLCFALASLAVGLPPLLAASPSAAGIPEPEAIYYGTLKMNGSLEGALSQREIRLITPGGDEIASYTMGESPEAGDFYVLRIALESPQGGAVTPGTATLGDEARVEIDGVAAAQVFIGARGRVTRMDLGGYNSALDVPDFDGDGVPDFQDLCSQLPGASQVDVNPRNGIADACEHLLNPGLAFVQVGHVDNPPDSAHDPDPGSGESWGSVSYPFSPSIHEVTNADFMNFLNSVADAEDPGGLYNEEMASDPRGGIVREGQTAPFTYKVKPNMADKPVNFVSWTDAARYANWLENGKPAGPPGAGTTEDGAFDLASVQDPGVDATFTGGAQNSLLTENEWYKSAYYDPADDSYHRFPTGSDFEPVRAIAEPGTGDVANPGAEVANYAANAEWNGQEGNVTTVGSANAPSPLGTHDQGGNVAEWLADDSQDGMRVARGGSYSDSYAALESEAGAVRADVLRDPAYEGSDVGIRVVPEPAGALCGLLGVGVVALLQRGQARRRGLRFERRPRR